MVDPIITIDATSYDPKQLNATVNARYFPSLTPASQLPTQAILAIAKPYNQRLYLNEMKNEMKNVQGSESQNCGDIDSSKIAA